MKIALVSAPDKADVSFVNVHVAKFLYKSEMLLPPIGLLYLASYLERDGHEVRVFNITVAKYPVDRLIDDIARFRPHLAGFSVSSSSFLDSLAIIKRLKARLDVLVVIGGPHVNVYKGKSMLSKHVDFGVYGEGEITLSELARAIEHRTGYSGIKGLIHKDINRKSIVNDPRPHIKNLDELLRPAYHLMDFDDYKSERFGNERFCMMFISRGGPFNCNFCYKNFHGFRLRSVANVIEEIRFLHDTHNISKIHFWDTTFTASEQWILDFAREVQGLPFRVEYTCSTRVDAVNENILSALKASGCMQVCYGIESFDTWCLHAMNKRITPLMITRALDLTRAVDIRVFCMFVLGIPGETRNTVGSTTRFILTTFLELIQIRPLQLLPGTPFYAQHLSSGGKDFWDEINHGKRVSTVEVPHGAVFSKKELDSIIRKTVLKYYLKPTNIYGIYKHKLGKFSILTYIKGFLVIVSMLLQFFKIG